MDDVEARPSAPRWVQWLLAMSALALVVVGTQAVLAQGAPNNARWRLLNLILVDWALFAVACLMLRKVGARIAVPVVLLGGVLLQVMAVIPPPQMTNDHFRYAWDGRVQAAGIDPYRYTPVDPALADLRKPWLFPLRCRDEVPTCTVINHKTKPTIYPPVAQAWFWGMNRASLGGRGERLPLQIGAGLLAVLTSLALLTVLRGRADVRQVAYWAWCPTVVLECGNNAHVDVLAALFTVLALGFAALPRRAGLAGVMLGAAFASKLLPALIGPALLRRRRRDAMVLVGAAVATVVVVYLPHLLAVGNSVWGFLPGYLHEEGYSGAKRYALLRLLLPDAGAQAVAVALLVVVAVITSLRSDRTRPWQSALLLTGVSFIVLGPAYPWYPLLVIALVALDGRWEWLVLGAAIYPVYFGSALQLNYLRTEQVVYGIALVTVVAVPLWRRETTRRSGLVQEAA